ncbi:MAG: dihydrolipoyl dehydrogenase [Planctomycetes bacterium]|nr:dihydrolipoyl dehydrogenase [Planctomycetota bacterium]
MVVGEFTQEADLVVIGGGPGGYTAALRAAAQGQKVTLIDDNAQLGGVCLRVGCIPSKALLHVAEIMHLAETAGPKGLEFAPPKINLSAMRAHKSGVIDKLTGGIAGLCKNAKVEVLTGRAELEGSKQLRLHGGEIDRIKFRRAVIATGSRPIAVPGISIDSPRVMDSTGALELEEIPKKLLIIGGGYIGLELGQVYAALGSEITVVEMLDQIMTGVDPDLARPLNRRLKEQFTGGIYVKTKVVKVSESGDGLKVDFEGDGAPTNTTFDRVLVSVGRRPNTDGLGLEHTSVKVNEQGFIEVDSQMRTADKRIFAIGDAVGNPLLAHKAIREGKVVADVLAGGSAEFDNVCIPAVVFTDPEIAWAGLTETEAKAQKLNIKVKKMPWGGSGRAVSMLRTNGLTKMICDADTGRVLGVGITGAHAGEMIAEAALAIEMGATAEDIAATIHPHPTLSETYQDTADMFGVGAVH